ncbi:hypothetical protein V5E97_28000 [Singulisphaera sp. Ch08]|uniref:Uncharacterized protein n=1 Tax=Singulisphaera sp. Ch08 TaxID=3120278 RepID=A0AAU7CA23_9BACT
MLCWVAIVSVASTFATPAFVTAQVRKEQAEVLVAPPARPGGAAKAEPNAKRATVAPKVRIIEPTLLVRRAIIRGEHWAKQYLPVLHVEYRLMRTICNPSKEERILIARAGFKALDEAAKNYDAWQNNRNRPNEQGAARPVVPNPRKAIQDALATAVNAHLSPDQGERYRVELEARSAEAKRVAILTVVAKLDHTLVLTVEQRSQLTDSLTSHWDESWETGLQHYNLDEQLIPPIPDPLISKFLSKSQIEVLRFHFQRVTPSASAYGIGVNNLDGQLDDEFPDAVAREIPKPETKK